jgi:xanthine dehydrogenase FAD-binding subunit
MFDVEGVYQAKSAAHAADLLRSLPKACIVAGGTDVLVKAREGEYAGKTLVSIAAIDALRGAAVDADCALRIGPLTSFSELMKNELISRLFPVLSEAAATVGGPQVRNAGTIGGNVCNGAPSADSAPTLLAYDALLEYSSSEGTRLVPIAAHYLGAGKTALAPHEILTAIIIPPESYQKTAGAYLKYSTRNAMDIATINCSANLRLSPGGTIERLRLSFGVAAPVPVRTPKAEAVAAGKPADEAAIAEIAAAARNEITPRDSWRASREFRLHLAEELCRRALRTAAERARAYAL